MSAQIKEAHGQALVEVHKGIFRDFLQNRRLWKLKTLM